MTIAIMASGGKLAVVVILCIIVVICVIALALGLYFGLRDDDDDEDNVTVGRIEVSTTGEYRNAAVASDAALCSEAGANVLASGGSAVDGTIATILCLGVVNCHSTGISGGGFMVVHRNDDPDNPVVIDFREVAPSNATKDMYADNATLSVTGGLAIAIPGMIKGLVHAYKKFGRNPWRSLVQPAINLAEQGFAIHKALAIAINRSREYILDKQNFPGLNNLFTKSDNVTLLQQGDMLRQPNLARTLRNIAERTPDEVIQYFYNSEFTDEMINEVNQYGGIFKKEDLINYEVNEYPALTTEFNGLRVLGTQAPSSGVIFNFVLNILKGYLPLNQTGLSYHLIIEAFKFAYAHRSLLGDPRNNSIVKEIEAFLLNDTTADLARSLINFTTTYPPEYYVLYNQTNMSFSQTGEGTSHLSVLAENGDSVAVTTTINFFFGSKVVSETSGIIFNDEMDDFSQPNRSNSFGLPPGPNNFIEPGKRPQSSTSPIIMLNGSTNAVIIGASGGSIITTATLISTINHLFFGFPIKEAIESPRIHHQWLPNVVRYEAAFSDTIRRELQDRNHVLELAGGLAVVQGITQLAPPNGTIFAHSDSRKGGKSAGY